MNNRGILEFVKRWRIFMAELRQREADGKNRIVNIDLFDALDESISEIESSEDKDICKRMNSFRDTLAAGFDTNVRQGRRLVDSTDSLSVLRDAVGYSIVSLTEFPLESREVAECLDQMQDYLQGIENSLAKMIEILEGIANIMNMR